LLDQSAAVAAVNDPNWQITCPTCTAGQVLHPTFYWTFTTSLNASANENYVFQVDPYGNFDVRLSMLMTPDNEGPENALNIQFNGGAGDPANNCQLDPVCPTFISGIGTISGAPSFSFSPYDEGVLLGPGNSATVDEAAEFIVSTGNTATVDPSLVMTGVSWTDSNGNAVDGVTLTTSAGVYADGAYTAFSGGIPEPPAWLLAALGLGAVAVWRIRTRGKACA
jgi:hypothetical protein